MTDEEHKDIMRALYSFGVVMLIATGILIYIFHGRL